jgi:hypothetical protein
MRPKSKQILQSSLDSKGGARARAALNSVGDALTAAGIATAEAAREQVPVAAMTVRQALASFEQPVGQLLREAQGQCDLVLARACVRRLVSRMAADGRPVSDTTQADAVGAACLALVQWRCSAEIRERLAARIAWRAVVDEVSNDCLGESVPVHTLSDDWLWFNRGQRDESRLERAARLRVERLAKTRHARLLRRLANLPPGRGKRKEAIERVGRAAVFLLQGERLDTAAQMAGFKAAIKADGRKGGDTTAGDRLIQAVKRIGLIGEHFAIRRARRN